MNERQVDWKVGVGRNRMSWWTRPVHWMVEEPMRPWDGSASWTEKAHYLAFGPLRLFIEPRLRSEAWLGRLSERSENVKGVVPE